MARSAERDDDGWPSTLFALHDCDPGRWRCYPFSNVANAELQAIALWMSDPEVAPHGGESVARLIHRVGRWLDGAELNAGVLAITHAAVIRAAIVHALGAAARCFGRIDAALLSITDLRRNDRRRTLRTITF